VPVYRYVVTSEDQKEECLAGTIDELSCDQDNRCTGKFYGHERQGCADPDAVITLEMDPPKDGRYHRVHRMSIQHNTSGRNLNALVRDNKDSLKFPPMELPGLNMRVNNLEPVCKTPAYCDAYKLKSRNKPDTLAYVTKVSCEKERCVGNLTLVGHESPSHQIVFDMERHTEPKYANTCQQDMYASILGASLRPMGSLHAELITR